MRVSILICTFGDPKWQQLAERRALPSSSDQGAHEVIVRHEREGTLASVRNNAALKAAGDWLCYLDADDELAPGYVAAMQDAMEDVRPYSLLVPRVQYVTIIREEEIAAGETGLVTKSSPPEFPNRHQPMTVMNHCVIGTLVPRHLFLELGGFVGHLSAYEDWEIFLRCVRGGAELVDVTDAIYRAYVSPDGRNTGGTSSDERQRAYWEIRRRYEPEAA